MRLTSHKLRPIAAGNIISRNCSINQIMMECNYRAAGAAASQKTTFWLIVSSLTSVKWMKMWWDSRLSDQVSIVTRFYVVQVVWYANWKRETHACPDAAIVFEWWMNGRHLWQKGSATAIAKVKLFFATHVNHSTVTEVFLLESLKPVGEISQAMFGPKPHKNKIQNFYRTIFDDPTRWS